MRRSASVARRIGQALRVCQRQAHRREVDAQTPGAIAVLCARPFFVVLHGTRIRRVHRRYHREACREHDPWSAMHREKAKPVNVRGDFSFEVLNVRGLGPNAFKSSPRRLLMRYWGPFEEMRKTSSKRAGGWDWPQHAMRELMERG
jgi:hypothetical protein